MNDFQFMPKIMKQLAGFNSFLGLRFLHVDLQSQPLHNTFTGQQTLHLKRIQYCNQVGEMFANYNLIAAMPLFYCPIGKIYERKFTHFYCMRWTWSYIHLFHTEPTVFTMEWLPMIGVGIWASILSVLRMLSGSLPSNKMGYYMGVFNFIVIPN
jgi:maltose/moltooligosaccharide transporter